MSRKSRNKERKQGRPGYWKLIDDKSGFVMYSDEVVKDWRGRLTTQDNWDPIHPSELPPRYREPKQVLPFYRVPPEVETEIELDE